jgi:hypothetical protein
MSLRRDRAEETVRFAADPCGEQQGPRRAGDAVAELQRPQAVDQDRVAVRFLELP